MRRMWPGWLLCGLTAILFAYMTFGEGADISARIDGMLVPDAVILGYDLEAATALHAAFKTDLALAETEPRQSASAAYVSMHAGSDLVFPPMLAASLAFLAYAGFKTRNSITGPSRLGKVALGLAFALAFACLGCDYVENAVADAMFGPPALETGLNAGLVPVLRGLTAGKYLSLSLAAIVVAALWVGLTHVTMFKERE